MRKYSWLVSLALVFAMLRPAFAAPMFPDVPDMWAKDAVAALAAKGILEGYPDGTFKGDRAATRYEVAMIVARLLAKMEQEHATFATKADLDELRKLVNQLREELDALGVRVQNLEDNVAKLDKRVTELERITFYGSLDARFASIRVNSDGLANGINGSQLGGQGGTALSAGGLTTALTATTGSAVAGATAAATTIGILGLSGAGVTAVPGTSFTSGVGLPMLFAPGAAAAGGGRPLIVREFPWNVANFNSSNEGSGGLLPAAATQGTGTFRPNYNNAIGSSYSNGGNAGGGATGGIGFFGGLTGRVGQTFSVPLVVPTFEVRTGRALTNGVGWSGEGVLGVRIKLNEDMDAGAEFAAFYSTGDLAVDSLYGVSANRLSNVYAGNSGPSGGVLANDGQGLNNQPFTRMNIDNFWFVHKPSGVKLQLGAYGDTAMDSIVYQPEYNPNLWGPRYLDNYGFRVSGTTHLLAKLDWEVFGSNAADGNRVAPEILAVGGAAYKPYLWGADFKWSFGQEGNAGRLKFNILRIWDDPAAGQAQTVGSISNVNGVWTNWVNPNGFYAAQINPGGPADVGNAQHLAGAGSTSDVRPIIPTSAGPLATALPAALAAGGGGIPASTGTAGTSSFVNITGAGAIGNIPGLPGQDAAVGRQGNTTAPINPAVLLSGRGQASTFGPQSMFTWGVSGGWDYSWSDSVKFRFLGEYSNSDYKPSMNSSYRAPDGTAWRVGLGATLFSNWDLDGEYVTVDPFHNPYILQYPAVGGITQAYWRIPTLSWFPELYPVNDKDVFPNNREGWRAFLKFNPTDPKDGKKKTVAWAEYGNMDQERSSLQEVRHSTGSISVGNPGVINTAIPNGNILGDHPGYIETIFAGFHPNSFAEFTGSSAPSATNQFQTPLENPKGRVTNFGVGLNYRFDQLNGLALHAGYKSWEFKRGSSLTPQFGGSENNIDLDLSGGLVALQFPVNERFSLKGGYGWTDIKGHFDPSGVYRNFALDTGSTNFQTFNNEQRTPFVGFDYDIARNVTWNVTAKFLDSSDKLGTFNSPNFFMQRNPYSWNATQVFSQMRVTF